MIVTLVSQCEKKALAKTRQILDAFANRIGDNTWQTVITQAGLDAVQASLRKTASKNTAVACHRLHGYSRTELVWIVGNRRKFNSEGHVPVHTTQADILPQEDRWHYLPLIKTLIALAALFHDWGKATLRFQNKLKQKSLSGDPLRHEWISCLLLHAFVHCGSQIENDEDWLQRLLKSELDEDCLKKDLKNIQKPLANLPPAAGLIAWLVLSHHRLPMPKEEAESLKGFRLENFTSAGAFIKATFGYENKQNTQEYVKEISKCFEFPEGILSQSDPWLKQLKKWSARLLEQMPLFTEALDNGCWRLLLHHCRLSLMLGDHCYSSQPQDIKWVSNVKLIANTDRQSGKPKQKLDEHLVNVAQKALHVSHVLPIFANHLRVAHDIQTLKKKSPPDFAWQDKAVKEIKVWRAQLPESVKIEETGFFAVNLASTGCGKTLANAKIMQTLSKDRTSLRYALCLGLRTLTLQTGDEYRQRIGLDETQMAVMIGSQAVRELHQIQKMAQEDEAQTIASLGSESLEPLLDGEIDYSSPIQDDHFNTVLTTNRDKQFLDAPVLVCTIDHMMAATETKRGGRYILPSLRLLSSDLVIDEVDDFDGSDLIAIGRLIHLAGMLGRKVMISSATIPPDLAEGYFNAYREGWLLYSQFCQVSSTIACAWIDEFNTLIVPQASNSESNKNYSQSHQQFISKRVANLSNPTKVPIRRKGQLVLCEDLCEEKSEETLKRRYFERIRETILAQHSQHFLVDPKSQKKVSVGVVRVANIEPCISLAQYLLQAEWDADMQPKIMAYHSRQVMLLRSFQESHLDEILQRTEHGEKTPRLFNNPVIRQHLDTSSAENVIFILVATPVEEIGRNHDFDWAVVEPSSYRSIIQLSGRVLRHRKQSVETANIAIMQYNLKALQGKPVAYTHPGYEQPPGNASGQLQLETHDLNELLLGCEIEKSITAIPRIQKSPILMPSKRLVDLEHQTMTYLLTQYDQVGAESLQGWLKQVWWLTALPQYLSPFRQGNQSIRLYRIRDRKSDDWVFAEKTAQGELIPRSLMNDIQPLQPIESSQTHRLWLNRDYAELLKIISEAKDISLNKAAERYGEISIQVYSDEVPNLRFDYSDQFGLQKRAQR